MARAIDYLQIAIHSTRTFAKTLFVQLNGKLEDIIMTGVLLLVISSLIYLFLCYAISGVSEIPRYGKPVRKNYLLALVRIILWIIVSAALCVFYYAIVIEAAQVREITTRCFCCFILAQIVGYGALFASPSQYPLD